jgi:hypothetical protein
MKLNNNKIFFVKRSKIYGHSLLGGPPHMHQPLAIAASSKPTPALIAKLTQTHTQTQLTPTKQPYPNMTQM